MLGGGQGPDPGDWTYTVAELQREKTANMASSKWQIIPILKSSSNNFFGSLYFRASLRLTTVQLHIRSKCTTEMEA